MSWSGPEFTRVEIPVLPDRIRYADRILLTGSCFSEHIANKLKRYKYQVVDNPFGILYNPVSLAESFRRIVNRMYYQADELIFHDGLYHSVDHHGSFSNPDAAAVLGKIRDQIDHAFQHLKHCRYVFISPGTSWVYKLKSSGHIVGNCHKIPQTFFEKSKLDVRACVDAFEKITGHIRQLSPGARIIWTVSPVRHLRDGLIENQRSKSTLIVAIEEVIRSSPDSYYFPAYEIMLDQLRDYRYYAEDLVHPSASAIDIIWEVFRETYIDRTESEMHSLIDKIKKATGHRFLHERPGAVAEFANAQLNLVHQAEQRIPGLAWEEEKQYFNSLFQVQS